MIPGLEQLNLNGEAKISPEANEVIFQGGANEIAAIILSNLYAGDEEDGKNIACNAAINWIQANKHLLKYKNEDTVWKALVENVFPNASPGTLRYINQGNRRATYQEKFYELCNRHENYRTQKKAMDKMQPIFLEAQAQMAQALREYFALFPPTAQNGELMEVVEKELNFPLGQRAAALPAMVNAYMGLDRTAPGFNEKMHRMTRFRQARHKLWLAMEGMRVATDNLEDARALLTQWTIVPHTLMIRRQKQFDPFDYPANPDDDADGAETFNRTVFD